MDTSFGKTLEASPFWWVYKIPFIENDEWIAIAGQLFFAINVFSVTIWGLQAPIPYGKAAGGKSSNSGFFNRPISAKTTWRFGLIWALIIPAILFATSPSLYLWELPNLVGIVIYLSHFFHRCIIYPSKFSSNAQPTPLFLFGFYSYFSCLDSFFQIHFMLNILKPMEENSQSYIFLVLGILMTALGFYINSYHDGLLTELKGRGKGYQIPTGGLFKYISAANYFGEILEMWGFALVTRAPMQVLYALSTTMALSTRANFTHRFYKERFGGKYPKERKALIPFVF